MDWNHTNPSWDAISRLNLQDNTNYQHHYEALTSSTDHHHHHHHHHQSTSVLNTDMFSVDLKLGRLEDMTMTVASSPQTSASTRTRGRARSAGAQTMAYCSVDGCTADLSLCREYHRRHRVCERHSKTPVVLIGGKEQRFCQQCSRFHSLGEFDEVKRSCRKRLDGHNRRRRKTQPENFYMKSADLQSTNTGTGLIQFRNLQTHTSPSPSPSPWPVLPQHDQKSTAIYTHYDPITSLSDNLSWSTISNSSKDVVKVSQLNHSECALSLLSSRDPPHSSELYAPNHMTQPLTTRSSPHGFGQFSGTRIIEEESSASISSTSNENSGYSFGGFLTGHDGFCGNTSSSRVFPFTWG